MMARGAGFLASVDSLWLPLSTVAPIGLLFFLTLQLPLRLVAWSFYPIPAEAAFEIAAYAVFLALIGVALGAVFTMAVAPFGGLGEAQMRDLDRSAENPALAQTFRKAIYARLPELPRKFA